MPPWVRSSRCTIGHPPPAHPIVLDKGQQAAVQDGNQFAQHPPNNEQRSDQHGQIRQVLNPLLDAGLEPGRPDKSHLETNVAQGSGRVIVNRDGLRLQQLAMGQQHPQLLAEQRFLMDGVVKPRPHHLRDAGGIVAVGLIDLRCARDPSLANDPARLIHNADVRLID
jgi:hypothetical protein